MKDVNTLFAAAEAAFTGNRHGEAQRLLKQVRSQMGDHPAIWHLTALVERRLGNVVDARTAFARAHALDGRNPQILNNYANFLDAQGETDAALSLYDRALAIDSGFADARCNRALLLEARGRPDEALAELDRLLAASPRHAKALSARGSVLKTLGRLDDAEASYAAALVVAPRNAVAQRAGAQLALQRGRSNAADLYRRALAEAPAERTLVLGLAEAMEAEGDPEKSLSLLESTVATCPDWIEGQERLAQMLAEQGADDFARGYEAALASRPDDRGLHYSYWRTLAGGGKYAAALQAIAAARARLGEDRESRLMEAVFLGEMGQAAAAEKVFDGLAHHPEVASARARNLLRLGQADRGAEFLETVVGEGPGDISAWALLGLAWRILGDGRHDWLCGQPGLYAAVDLPIAGADLAELAVLLRGLHRSRSHPIGQSLRGGTQTRGRLFWRTEPAIVALKAVLDEAIVAYVDRLPELEPDHPLLRHREASFTIEGSWSVRLARSGFHVSHIHPKGVLSSACYIALPEDLGGADKAGWLELGAPPVELGLDLPPLALVEPRPSRLVLFPSYFYHGTLPFSSGERLTVAFDAVPG